MTCTNTNTLGWPNRKGNLAEVSDQLYFRIKKNEKNFFLSSSATEMVKYIIPTLRCEVEGKGVWTWMHGPWMGAKGSI